MRQVSFSECRDQFETVINNVDRAPVEVVVDGKGIAVILSIDEYRKLKGERLSFAEAYKAFTDRHNLSELALPDVLFQRDRSSGR